MSVVPHEASPDHRRAPKRRQIMFDTHEQAAELESVSGPGWDDYLAARDRFLARLQAERVLREVVRCVADGPVEGR